MREAIPCYKVILFGFDFVLVDEEKNTITYIKVAVLW